MTTLPPIHAGSATPAPPDDEQLLRLLAQDKSLLELRYIKDLPEITRLVTAIRAHTPGTRIVLTSGSFDVIHEGHSMYLEAAREMGDFLVVGVDSDEKIRQRKGPTRPAVPEQERLRMVTHQRGVGLVALKHPTDARWALIKAVCPDVLVATEETYTPAEIAQLESQWCGRVVVLPRMATISTSARLRLAYLGVTAVLADRLPSILQEIVIEMADAGEAAPSRG
jgi:rfaE bifunctional protein nucleotidyltransferase chain/domain